MNLELTDISLAHHARTLIAFPALPKLAATLVVLLGLLFSGNLVADDKLDFNRDIRPILSDNCFLCHGPAASTRAAELRLDKREPAIAANAIKPGNPSESDLVDRIFSDDPDSIMPPPDSNKKLTSQQKEILKRWIKEGAEYQQHWSFVSPERQPEAKFNRSVRCEETIDCSAEQHSTRQTRNTDSSRDFRFKRNPPNAS